MTGVVTLMELFLFTVDATLASRAAQAGIAGFVVDWEHRHKQERQREADTQINDHTPDDLARLRSAVNSRILCRINSSGPHLAEEIELAVECGADEVLLPMVRHPAEVEAALRLLNSRRPLAILVETKDAVAAAADLGRLPLSRVYIGLNDLSIDRQSPSIFTALADGTIDQIRHHFPMQFGFGGATLPELGSPIPCRLLIGEIARLEGSYTFLRRSFLKDTGGQDLSLHVPRIQAAFDQARRRTADEIARDRQAFLDAVREIA